mgnify:CR=1 FL=1
MEDSMTGLLTSTISTNNIETITLRVYPYFYSKLLKGLTSYVTLENSHYIIWHGHTIIHGISVSSQPIVVQDVLLTSPKQLLKGISIWVVWSRHNISVKLRLVLVLCPLIPHLFLTLEAFNPTIALNTW